MACGVAEITRRGRPASLTHLSGVISSSASTRRAVSPQADSYVPEACVVDDLVCQTFLQAKGSLGILGYEIVNAGASPTAGLLAKLVASFRAGFPALWALVRVAGIRRLQGYSSF